MKTKNNFNSITILCVVLFAIFSISTSGQETDSKKLKEKIKEIKGDIDKITITADGKTYEFAGEEAKNLFKRLKSDRMKKFKVNVDEDDDAESMVWVMLDDDDENSFSIYEHGGKNLMFITEELEGDGEVEKEVKVEVDDDGKKKITVKTEKDGEETTEVFEGKEAEEYLAKMKADKKMFMYHFGDDDDLEWIDEDDGAMSFMSEEMTDGDKIIKKIDVTKKDGETKVVVTTTKDGKETTETYEGDEAEEYLEKMNKGKHIWFNKSKDADGNVFIIKDKDVIIKKMGDDGELIEVKVKKGDKKKMKKIIIKKEKDDDDKDDKN